LRLGRNGLAPAEENHSSVVAYIGEGGLWCITEHTYLVREDSGVLWNRSSTFMIDKRIKSEESQPMNRIIMYR
jgi:hypothetical protein